MTTARAIIALLAFEVVTGGNFILPRHQGGQRDLRVPAGGGVGGGGGGGFWGFGTQ